MSSLSQTPWLCSLHTTKSTRFFPANHGIPSLKFPAFSVDSSKEESLPEPASSNPSSDRIKLAFERAQKYKKSLISNQVGESKDVLGDNEMLAGGGDVRKGETLGVVAAAVEKEGVYQNNAGLPNSEDLSEDNDDGKEEVSDAIRIAMEKAREYKQNQGKVNNDKTYKERDQLPGM